MNEYKDERDILEKDIKALEGKSATYSGVRFVMFLAALAGLIIGIYDNRVTVLILGIIAAVALSQWCLSTESLVRSWNIRKPSRRCSGGI